MPRFTHDNIADYSGKLAFKIYKMLHKIGALHEIRCEHDDSLNVFNQALDAARNLRKKTEFSTREIAQFFQHKEDASNVIKVFK